MGLSPTHRRGEGRCASSRHTSTLHFRKKCTYVLFLAKPVSIHIVVCLVFSYGNMSPGPTASVLPNDTQLPLHVEGDDPT